VPTNIGGLHFLHRKINNLYPEGSISEQPTGSPIDQLLSVADNSLIWRDPVHRCPYVVFLSLFVSSFEDRACSSRGRIERRLISLIFAGRNRIIMIRRELPLTKVASPAEPVA
jgi:hypothetical protein